MTDFIELTVTVNGTTYPVRCELPSSLKASSGPMSVRSALEPCVMQLLERMVQMLEQWMPHPRVAVVEANNDLRPSA